MHTCTCTYTQFTVFARTNQSMYVHSELRNILWMCGLHECIHLRVLYKYCTVCTRTNHPKFLPNQYMYIIQYFGLFHVRIRVVLSIPCSQHCSVCTCFYVLSERAFHVHECFKLRTHAQTCTCTGFHKLLELKLLYYLDTSNAECLTL